MAQLFCRRCEDYWTPTLEYRLPKRCARCNSQNWKTVRPDKKRPQSNGRPPKYPILATLGVGEETMLPWRVDSERIGDPGPRRAIKRLQEATGRKFIWYPRPAGLWVERVR